MCIRDRFRDLRFHDADVVLAQLGRLFSGQCGRPVGEQRQVCLLYTSDAADERSSVDLGGRRIIKKKN